MQAKLFGLDLIGHGQCKDTGDLEILLFYPLLHIACPSDEPLVVGHGYRHSTSPSPQRSPLPSGGGTADNGPQQPATLVEEGEWAGEDDCSTTLIRKLRV